MTYRDHIAELARGRNVHIQIDSTLERGNGSAQAFGPFFTAVVLPALDTDLDYVVALHELGHVYGNHLTPEGDRRRNNGDLLNIEAEATAWAYDHVLLPITDEAPLYSRAALGAYLRGNPRFQAGWPEWTLDPRINVPHRLLGEPGRIFWDTWARLGGTEEIVDDAVINYSAALYRKWGFGPKEAIAA